MAWPACNTRFGVWGAAETCISTGWETEEIHLLLGRKRSWYKERRRFCKGSEIVKMIWQLEIIIWKLLLHVAFAVFFLLQRTAFVCLRDSVDTGGLTISWRPTCRMLHSYGGIIWPCCRNSDGWGDGCWHARICGCWKVWCCQRTRGYTKELQDLCHEREVESMHNLSIQTPLGLLDFLLLLQRHLDDLQVRDLKSCRRQ